MAEAKNLFLETLSLANRSALIDASVAVSLPLGAQLFDPTARITHAYFLTSGIASFVTIMSEGRSAEVAVIGREGVVGSLQLLGPARHPIHAMMQIGGSGFRIPLPILQRLFDESSEIRSRLLELIQVNAFTTLQVAGCGALHEVEARLCRWLLMVSDRTGMSELQFTQEFLAQMMGSRRTTVTMVASDMQRRGLIHYSRGRIRITDRKGLEKAACCCYSVSKTLLNQLFKRPLT